MQNDRGYVAMSSPRYHNRSSDMYVFGVSQQFAGRQPLAEAQVPEARLPKPAREDEGRPYE